MSPLNGMSPHRGCMPAVRFSLRCETGLGDRLFVVGGHRDFGSWDPECSKVELHTSASGYPVWHAEWQRRDSADVVRFKFVVRGANGSLRWEDSIDDRTLPVLAPGRPALEVHAEFDQVPLPSDWKKQDDESASVSSRSTALPREQTPMSLPSFSSPPTFSSPPSFSRPLDDDSVSEGSPNRSRPGSAAALPALPLAALGQTHLARLPAGGAPRAVPALPAFPPKAVPSADLPASAPVVSPAGHHADLATGQPPHRQPTPPPAPAPPAAPAASDLESLGAGPALSPKEAAPPAGWRAEERPRGRAFRTLEVERSGGRLWPLVLRSLTCLAVVAVCLAATNRQFPHLTRGVQLTLAAALVTLQRNWPRRRPAP